MNAKVLVFCVFVIGVMMHPVRAQMLSDAEDVTESFLYDNTLWPVEAERDASGKTSWLYDEETAGIAGYYAYELDFGDSGPNPVKSLLAVDESMAGVLLEKTPPPPVQVGKLGARPSMAPVPLSPKLDPNVFEGPTPLFVDVAPPSILDSRSVASSEFSPSKDRTSRSSSTTTPEPGTLLMVGFGLLGFGLLAKRRSKIGG